MTCHATGTTPNREYPRRNFIMLPTPIGIIWFRNRETAEDWVNNLSESNKNWLAGHDVTKTPGALVVPAPEQQP